MGSDGGERRTLRAATDRPAVVAAWALVFLAGVAGVSAGQEGGADPASDEEPAEEDGVRIVRRIPESGDHSTQATWTPWRAPPSEVVKRTEPDPAQLSGRLAVGSTGGLKPDGTRQLDVAADSHLTLVQPLGSGVALEMDGEARRTMALAGEREVYGGGFGLMARDAEVGVLGRYDRAVRSGEDFDEDTRELTAALAAELSYLETLPITLDVSYRAGETEEDDVRVELVEEYRGEVAAAGSVGAAEVQAAGRAEHTDDVENDYDITAVGANLGVTIQAGDRVALSPSVASTGTRTAYEETGASLETVGLETDLGLRFSPGETLDLRVVPGVVNVWTSQWGDIPEEDEAPEHTWTLQGLIGADYADESGGHGTGDYTVSKTLSGALRQRVFVSAGWSTPAGETATLDSVTADTSLSFVDGTERAEVSREHTWNLAVGIAPVETLEVDGGYDGSHVAGEDVVTTHGGRLSYRHTPATAISFGNAAAVTTTRTSDRADELEQVYSGDVQFTPHVGGGRPRVELSEEYLIRETSDENEHVSSLSSHLAVPVARSLRLRYSFGWDNYRSGGPVENRYSHEAGAGLGTDAVTSSFTYRYSHGDRPERHDVRTAIQVRFGAGFSMEGDLEWSRYKEDGERMEPFVGSVLIARSF